MRRWAKGAATGLTATTKPGAPSLEIDRFARLWAADLIDTSYVPMTSEEIDHLFHRLTTHLITALRDESFTHNHGFVIGTTLVTADFCAPSALGRTIGLIDARLLDTLGLREAVAPERLGHLLDAIATGYTSALRDRTLREQEEIRLAALAARSKAEEELLSSEAERHRGTLMTL